MKLERWHQIDQLYNQALEMEESQRTVFLRQACAGDDDLRRELEQLLAEEPHAACFLEKSALREIASEFAATAGSTAGSSWVGRQIGNYEFVSLAGAGGMGEVYRARDTKLRREVAIKILPDEFSRDPDRVSRFQREAQLLASLNHSNIAAIYDLEEAGEFRLLILELVEGETLEERLKRGPIPLDEALQIAAQIVEGLGAAHERGIIHRDLKPANIKLTPEGKVKVLDFGLAKAFAAETADVNLSNSPTKMTASTPGTILGTAAYMSPEQARGKVVDKRADIWAFGVVFHEMLTGKRLFKGDTLQDSLVQVMTKEPDWSRVPARVQFLLRRCLERDPNRRLRDIGDVPAWLEGGAATTLAPRATKWSRLLWNGIVAVSATALTLAVMHVRETAPAAAWPMRFQVPLAPGVRPTLTGSFTESPDGKWIAYVGIGSDGTNRLWVQSLESLEPRLLPDTEMFGGNTPPIWSPDSKSLAFYSQRQLKRTDLLGGAPQVICAVPSIVVGGSWNRAGIILFGQDVGGLMQVPEAGGTPTPVTLKDSSRGERNHAFPTFLPDGRHFIYSRSSPVAQYSGVYLGSLDNKPEGQPVKPLLSLRITMARFVWQAEGTGQLLYMLNNTLMSQKFDLARYELTGEAQPLAEQVGFFRSLGFFAASPNVLVYRSAPPETMAQLEWFDREGNKLEAVGSPIAATSMPALSPQGDRVVVGIEQKRTLDLWLVDLARGGVSQRLTSDLGWSTDPSWSSDGTEIVFTANPRGEYDVYRISGNGQGRAEPVYKSADAKATPSWSPDHRFLLFTALGKGTENDLWVLPLDGTSKAQPFAQSKAVEESGAFSPNGRWVAYVSNESGAAEVYVRPSPASSTPAGATAGSGVRVSAAGGTRPRWRGDSAELFYRAGDSTLVAVPVGQGTAFQPGPVRKLFKAPRGWDVRVDGKRFLFAVPVEQGTPGPFTVVVNWQADLKK